jgi:DNA-binding response OmpR family regulator
VKKKILIVEDEKNIVLGLKMYLESKDYQVEVAKNGIEGVKKAKLFMPDLVLLDILLPAMSGYLVCETLKEDSQLNKIPIVFMSAKTQEEDIKKAYEVGGLDYIVKPFTHKKIDEIVKKYI